MDFRLQVVIVPVSDVDRARDFYAELAGRGVELSEIEVLGRPGRPGLKFAYFKDPDGNGWTLQELPGSAT
jgi:catechol 2,3-dioxygenase-like lactoylglutathione lyase family enzyme